MSCVTSNKHFKNHLSPAGSLTLLMLGIKAKN
jgi:hypothetical protein